MQFNLNDIPVSDRLEKVVEDNMNKIYKEQKQKKMRKTIAAVSSAAAVFVAGFVFLASNPVLAAKIPIVGNLFANLQDDVTYSGDYTETAEKLDDEQLYTQTIEDMTVTLSEIYCNEQALYLTMMLEADNGFPATMIDQDDKPLIALDTMEKYSVSDEEILMVRSLEGKFVDNNTYTGLMRISFEEMGLDLSENGVLPADFDLKLTINKVVGDKEEPIPFEWKDIEGNKIDQDTMIDTEDMTDEEWDEFTKTVDFGDMSFPNENENYWYDGPWVFDLKPQLDDSRTETIKVNTTNEDGIGLERIVKTPYELSIYETYPSDQEAFEYFSVVLDENGEILPQGSGLTTTYAVQKQDISKVYVYICDYNEYMNELKGYYYSDDYETNKAEKTFKQLLDERAVYSEEVEF